MSKSLDAACTLVLADFVGRLCMLDITIQDKSLNIIGVYASNDHAEWLKLFLTTFYQVVLAGGLECCP